MSSFSSSTDVSNEFRRTGVEHEKVVGGIRMPARAFSFC